MPRTYPRHSFGPLNRAIGRGRWAVVIPDVVDHVLVLSETRRVLRSGGLLSLAVPCGRRGRPFRRIVGAGCVSQFFIFFVRTRWLTPCNLPVFEVEKIVERDPYPEIEAQTCRGYILATKRGTA
jgi:hypothetical protein